MYYNFRKQAWCIVKIKIAHAIACGADLLGWYPAHSTPQKASHDPKTAHQTGRAFAFLALPLAPAFASAVLVWDLIVSATFLNLVSSVFIALVR